jgi:adenylate cyclase
MLLQIDPSAEPVHQFLIRLLSTSGQHGAARRQLQTCRRILRVEFGIEPAPETERLLGAVVSAPRSLAEATRKFGQGESGIPSVVVLPFEETLDDGELERIGAGLIDDITMELTRYRSFFVISHDSANAFRTGREDVSELCARLGVRHALCGGIRRTRAGYRINIRLVEGANGQSLWSERYDLAGDDFVDVSDAVTTELVSRLAGSLESEALSRTRRVPAESWDAYSHLLQGLAYHHKSWHATRNVVMAIKHFEQAIELDPTCARAYAHLACARAWPWGRRRDNSLLDPCIVLARRAIELDPLEAEGHRMLGGIHLVRAEHDLSAECFAKAEALNPGHADIRAHAARHYMHVGNLRRATENLGKARQLNPLHPTWYWEHFAVASFIAQDYEETLISLSRMSSHSFYDRLYAAAASAYLGRDANARRHVELALISRPNLTVKNVVRVLPYKDQEKIKHVVDGLYRAGLPS